jgi:NAD(P)-dependent dehydrogenase (short-subunit alcohol dehydrogenase family)
MMVQVFCLVNNAGVMGEKEGWQLCMDINLTGAP